MRGFLCIGLLLASATALRTSSKSKYASADVAAAEVGRRCTALDFSGAVEVLEAHGRPVGWQLGKQLLKTCFMDKEGQCLLGKAKCAWMQKCFSAEGPCERPPIQASFLEVEGGQVAIDELARDKNAPADGGFPAAGWPLVNAAKKLLKAIPEKLKYSLLMAKGARDTFKAYVPEQKKQIWFYKLASLGLWFVLACATEYNNIKMMGVGGAAQPVYAWYAPMGIYRDPAYTYPIFESKLLQKTEDWKC